MPGRVVPLTAGTSAGLSANAQPFSLWPFCIKWAFISWCWVLRERKWKLLKLLETWFWRFLSIHYTADKSHSCQTELKGRSCELHSREVVKTYKDSEDWRQPSRETPSLYVQTSVIPITLFMKGWSPFKNPFSTVNLLNMTLQKNRWLLVVACFLLLTGFFQFDAVSLTKQHSVLPFLL